MTKFSFQLDDEKNAELEKITRIYGFESKTAALYEIIRHAEDILRIWFDLGDQAKQGAKDLRYKQKVETLKENLRLKEKLDQALIERDAFRSELNKKIKDCAKNHKVFIPSVSQNIDGRTFAAGGSWQPVSESFDSDSPSTDQGYSKPEN